MFDIHSDTVVYKTIEEGVGKHLTKCTADNIVKSKSLNLIVLKERLKSTKKRGIM